MFVEIPNAGAFVTIKPPKLVNCAATGVNSTDARLFPLGTPKRNYSNAPHRWVMWYNFNARRSNVFLRWAQLNRLNDHLFASGVNGKKNLHILFYFELLWYEETIYKFIWIETHAKKNECVFIEWVIFRLVVVRSLCRSWAMAWPLFWKFGSQHKDSDIFIS